MGIVTFFLLGPANQQLFQEVSHSGPKTSSFPILFSNVFRPAIFSLPPHCGQVVTSKPVSFLSSCCQLRADFGAVGSSLAGLFRISALASTSLELVLFGDRSP